MSSVVHGVHMPWTISFPTSSAPIPHGGFICSDRAYTYGGSSILLKLPTQCRWVVTLDGTHEPLIAYDSSFLP